jgi:hypothetical protein
LPSIGFENVWRMVQFSRSRIVAEKPTVNVVLVNNIGMDSHGRLVAPEQLQVSLVANLQLHKVFLVLR